MSELSKNKIKWIRSLHQKKHRDELGLFLVEGEKMVQEALDYFDTYVVCIAHTSEFSCSTFTGEKYSVSTKELEQISTQKNPNKVVAVLRQFTAPNDSIDSSLVLAIDGVQDPGNFGTILRIADWFGISRIVCSKNTVENYNPKVVQASMGAIFRVQTTYVDLVEWLTQQTVPIYGALLEGENIYEQSELPAGILILGNEGNGISPEIIAQITHPISIPRFGLSESLNVSVATGILVSEFIRRNPPIPVK